MPRGRHRPPGSLALTPDQLELFEATIPRVERAAKHLARIIGADRDEALSACLVALASVVQHFEPARGFCLTTLLWPSLYRAVQRVKRQDRPIHIPSHFFAGEMRPDHAERARRVLGMARLKDHEEYDLPLIDPSIAEPTAGLIAAEEAAELERLLSFLPSRQRLILKARARDVRLETIGQCLGITRSRVHQIEHDALAAVRRLANLRGKL